MKYSVLDLESSVKNKGEESIGSFAANPFHPDNYIVMGGYTVQGYDAVRVYGAHTGATKPSFRPDKTIDMLVGQNIGFDLLLMLLDERSREECIEWLKKGRIWDTMLAEYILTAQNAHGTSLKLDALSKKYGGTIKDEKIKQYWDDGVETEDIPTGELEEYLVADVNNTRLVFLHQLKQCIDRGILPLVIEMMDARLATIMMEYDGIHFDIKAANEYLVDLTLRELSVTGLIADFLAACYPSDFVTEVWTSQKVVHPALFGGEVKYEVRHKTGVFKSGAKKGKPRFKIEKKTHNMVGALEGHTLPEGLVKGKNGMYSLDENALKLLREIVPKGSFIEAFLGDMLKLREIKKEREMTQSLIDLTWHDSKLHPRYNHTVTKTGRLSATAPNPQQVTK